MLSLHLGLGSDGSCFVVALWNGKLTSQNLVLMLRWCLTCSEKIWRNCHSGESWAGSPLLEMAWQTREGQLTLAFLFVFAVQGLNPGPCTCWAGTLLLSHTQPFLFFIWDIVWLSCPGWLWACGSSASASQGTGVTRVHHCAQLAWLLWWLLVGSGAEACFELPAGSAGEEGGEGLKAVNSHWTGAGLSGSPSLTAHQSLLAFFNWRYAWLLFSPTGL